MENFNQVTVVSNQRSSFKTEAQSMAAGFALLSCHFIYCIGMSLSLRLMSCTLKTACFKFGLCGSLLVSQKETQKIN